MTRHCLLIGRLNVTLPTSRFFEHILVVKMYPKQEITRLTFLICKHNLKMGDISSWEDIENDRK